MKSLEEVRIAYIMMMPDMNGTVPSYVQEVAKHFKVLHPAYDYSVDIDLDKTNLPLNSNPWAEMVLRDMWAQQKANILIYDIDSNPGYDQLYMAHSLDRNVVGVSKYLKSFPTRYSFICNIVVTPKGLIALLPDFVCV